MGACREEPPAHALLVQLQCQTGQNIITKTSAYFPSYDQVPRGLAKVSLLEDGLYLDPTELDKSRGEARL